MGGSVNMLELLGSWQFYLTMTPDPGQGQHLPTWSHTLLMSTPETLHWVPREGLYL